MTSEFWQFVTRKQGQSLCDGSELNELLNDVAVEHRR